MTSAVPGELVPVLRSVIDVPWFFSIDVLGTIAFAISGLVLARRDRFSLVGAFVLAGLPAAGGGMLRDLLLGRPVAFLGTPLYLALIVATVLVGFLVFRIVDAIHDRGHGNPASHLPRHATTTVECLDALGLASFTVTGVVVAVESLPGHWVVWGPLFAMLTATGGGILRDLVRADKHSPLLKRAFYAEAALIWGFLLSTFLTLVPAAADSALLTVAVALTMAGAFATRWLAVMFDWRSPRFSLRTGLERPSTGQLPGAGDDASPAGSWTGARGALMGSATSTHCGAV